MNLITQLDVLLTNRRWLVAGIMSVVLAAFWTVQLTGSAVEKDAAETLRMAVNLAHQGVASIDAQAPFTPAMTREPVPVAVSAIMIRLMELAAGPVEDNAYFSGNRARVLKLQNVFWFALLCAVVFGSTLYFTSSPSAAIAGVVLVNMPLFDADRARYLLNSLYTESPAAALLSLGSFLLVLAIARRNWKYMAGAGLTFALLALVKAVFLYVFAGLFFVLLLVRLLAWRQTASALPVLHMAIVALAFSIVAVPWMYRNYVALGHFEIVARGGEILYHRAVDNRMTSEERRGALSFWAPWPINGLLRRLFGFSNADYEHGGRLQGLNRGANTSFAAADLQAELLGRPEDTVSNYRRSRAELSRLIISLMQQGYKEPAAIVEASDMQKERAIQMIKERPLEHLAMTPLFLWRGAFFAFPLLVIGLLWAARQRDYLFGLFLTPAFGMVMFYALFSHFIPRYSMPALPVVVVAFVVLGHAAWHWAANRSRIDTAVSSA